jgi:hypothetical protein
MYKISSCPCCGSSDINIENSKLARFVAWRITGIPVDSNIDIQALKCNNCTFYCTLDRFTIEEETLLYSGYRETEYNKLRVLCEPMYESRISTFDNEQYMIDRSVGINTLISNNIPDISLIKTVLDYGGDTGSHIPKSLANSRKVVYDISGVDTVVGVESLQQNSTEIFDFVMCCHVLEHKSDLDSMIVDIKRFISGTSFVYFEVPNTTLDVNSQSIDRFHEHINLFNKYSLPALLNKHGFSVVDLIETKFLCVLVKLDENCISNRSN